MLPRINPTSTQAWFVLQKHYEEEMNRRHMRDLFASDPDRFKKFSITLGDILFDYSKNIINEKTLKLLLQLAEDCNVKQAIAEQFAGVAINETENRINFLLGRFPQEIKRDKTEFLSLQPANVNSGIPSQLLAVNFTKIPYSEIPETIPSNVSPIWSINMRV